MWHTVVAGNFWPSWKRWGDYPFLSQTRDCARDISGSSTIGSKSSAEGWWRKIARLHTRSGYCIVVLTGHWIGLGRSTSLPKLLSEDSGRAVVRVSNLCASWARLKYQGVCTYSFTLYGNNLISAVFFVLPAIHALRCEYPSVVRYCHSYFDHNA